LTTLCIELSSLVSSFGLVTAEVVSLPCECECWGKSKEYPPGLPAPLSDAELVMAAVVLVSALDNEAEASASFSL
jgi:hypothetical protein